MADIAVNDIVLVAQKQQRGNITTFEQGKVISLKGQNANVLLAGEDFTQPFPVSQLQVCEDTLGLETLGAFDNQVINQIRR